MMPRFRNPRYAPEFLERRLSPSDLGAIQPPALIAPSPAPEPEPQPEPSSPPTDPSLPPLGDPLPPAGPALPG